MEYVGVLLVSVISKQTNSSILLMLQKSLTYLIFEEIFHHVDSLLVKILYGLSRPGIVKVESF